MPGQSGQRGRSKQMPVPQKRRPAWQTRRARAPTASPNTGRSREPTAWRDQVQAIGTLLVGIAAIAALVFSGLSIRATNGQLQETRRQLNIDEQGQITDRLNAAIA